jgi:ABC-type uncharacterized transport system permease subunit
MTVVVSKLWQAIIKTLSGKNAAVIYGMIFAGAFMQATFIQPSIVERVILIITAFALGWHFSRQYYEVDADLDKLKTFIKDCKESK